MTDPDPPAPRRRRRKAALALVGGLVLAGAWVFRLPLFAGNFAAVEPGRVYRGAQPGAELRDRARRLALASILNLRAGAMSDRFYREELAAARDLGLDFYDLDLSATRRPTRQQLLQVLDVLGRCRYPLLIHCKWGSDRTGLAVALYRMSIRGEPPERALSAFAVAHGHIPLFGTERVQQPISEYARWLRARDLTHTPQRLRDWVLREYEADDPPAEAAPVRPGSRYDEAARRPVAASQAAGRRGPAASNGSTIRAAISHPSGSTCRSASLRR